MQLIAFFVEYLDESTICIDFHFHTLYLLDSAIYKCSTKEAIFFIWISYIATDKYNKKLQSPVALNIKEIPGYKQKENVKK